MSETRVIERWECPTHGNAYAPVMTADETPHCGRRQCGLQIVKVEYVPGARLEALKARLRQEVDAHRMTLHEHALPMSDEEFDEMLGTIPGFEEVRDAD